MVRLQPLVRHRLAALGDAGARWRDDLPAVLDDLAGRWGFEHVRGLPGGSASYVAEVRTDAGPRVLKVAVPVPGEPGVADEARVLGAAQGRGYALLHAYAADHGALLMERLGRSLEQTPGEPATRLDRLVDVLREAWTAPLVGERVAKAEQLADLVAGGARRHGCDPAVLRQAVAYAEELAEPGPDGEVLLHGDAHPGNVLRRDGGATRSSTRTASSATRRTTPGSPCASGTPASPTRAGRCSSGCATGSPSGPGSTAAGPGGGPSWSGSRPGSTCSTSGPSGWGGPSSRPLGCWSTDWPTRSQPAGRNLRHMELTSPEAVATALGDTGYLADDDLATVVFLARTMQRPLLLEGEPGTGKTSLAEALAQLDGVPLVRLQCYEGIDSTQALYDWDFPRQILHLRTLEASAAGGQLDPDEAEKGLFDERFLLARPVLRALREAPTVLLVDEVDRADDEFEAFLLEVLSSWTVSIPELGTVTAAEPPLVVLTSNRTRDLHDALKRRCLYHWIGHPGLEREVAIVRSRLPEVSARLAEQVATVVHQLREQHLLKPPGVAETLDWARALHRLGNEELDLASAARTLGAVVKYREDTDRVRDALDRIMRS
ncbi:AAA family ATPase [Nocardioides marmoraquaticus]